MDIYKALELIQQKLMIWLREFIKMLPNLVLAVVVLMLGLYLSKLVRNVTRRVVRRLSHGAVITDLLSSFIYILSVGITIFIALSILQLDKAVTTILAGAGIAGIALAFAFQDIAANFMSGILLIVRKPLRVGDIVKVKDYMGKVNTITLRDIVLRTFQGQMVIIPNKEVFQNPIENFSLLGKRRMDLTIGVSYGEDLDKVKEVVLNAVCEIQGIAADDPITIFYEAFVESSINFSLRIWAATPEQIDYLRVRDEAIRRIKKAFDENDIMIPFPIRTLDFGIKGGKTLSEMKVNMQNEDV